MWLEAVVGAVSSQRQLLRQPIRAHLFPPKPGPPLDCPLPPLHPLLFFSRMSCTHPLSSHTHTHTLLMLCHSRNFPLCSRTWQAAALSIADCWLTSRPTASTQCTVHGRCKARLFFLFSSFLFRMFSHSVFHASCRNTVCARLLFYSCRNVEQKNLNLRHETHVGPHLPLCLTHIHTQADSFSRIPPWIDSSRRSRLSLLCCPIRLILPLFCVFSPVQETRAERLRTSDHAACVTYTLQASYISPLPSLPPRRPCNFPSPSPAVLAYQVRRGRRHHAVHLCIRLGTGGGKKKKEPTIYDIYSAICWF